MCWIEDLDTPKFCIEFLFALKEERAILLPPTPWKHRSWLDNSPNEEARKKEDDEIYQAFSPRRFSYYKQQKLGVEAWERG